MNKSKTSLFLMELIIVILFFSVSAVVCVQLFVNAHLTTQSTYNESNSNIVVQNLAECFLGFDGDLNQIESQFEHSTIDTELNTLTCYYNSNWKPCFPSSDSAVEYTATLYVYSEGNMLFGNITILDKTGTTIATEEVKHYLQYEMEVQ